MGLGGGLRGLTDGLGVQETWDLQSLMNGSWVTLCPGVVLLWPCPDTRVVFVLTEANHGSQKAEARLTSVDRRQLTQKRRTNCTHTAMSYKTSKYREGMNSLLKEDRSVARRDDLSRPQQPALSTLPRSPLLSRSPHPRHMSARQHLHM